MQLPYSFDASRVPVARAPLDFPCIPSLAGLRAALWAADYRPVALYSKKKRPMGAAWQDRARRDPPEAATAHPNLSALNTGIMCDGLRALDIDCDDNDLAQRIEEEAVARFGLAPVRWRGNSGRRLLVYRAAEGEPPKRVLAGTEGRKLEVLGRGQQFHAYGMHPSGAELQWRPNRLECWPRADLPAVTEPALAGLLATIAPWLGAAQDAPLRPLAPAATDTAYGRAALRSECEKVASAPPGFQEATLNTAGLKIGGLVAGNELARDSAAEHLHRAAGQMANAPGERPWTPAELHAKVERALRHGGASPRQAPKTANDAGGWPDPVDFMGDGDLTGAPELRPEHLPDALAPFVFDTAERMGVDPASVFLAAIVSVSAVIDERFSLQPKRHDYTWREGARLWGALIGAPSILKSPVIAAASRPLESLEKQARAVHELAMAEWRGKLAALKADKVNAPAPPPPKMKRFMVEGATMEALQEVLRGGDEAKFHVPAGKILSRQDELAEFIANMDRYNAGGKGGGDRGAYLRLFNGGSFSVDRVGRGAFLTPHWSACLLGGIQPEPIQRIANASDDDGLLQRFMFAVPGEQGIGLDRVPDAAAIARYEALFSTLANRLHPEPHPLSGEVPPAVLHDDAQQYRAAVEHLVSATSAMPDVSTRLASSLGKWPGLFARLALTFHMIDVADAMARAQEPPPLGVIPAATAARVERYMRDILLPHLLRAQAVLYLSPQQGHARWLAGWFLSHGLTRVTIRDAQRAYGALRPPERRRELDAVMDSLSTMTWLKPEPHSNPAKPPTGWAVNPKVHSTFAVRATGERERRAEAQRQTAVAIRLSAGKTG